MRMRRKGNLDERIKNSKDYLIASEGSFTNSLEFIKNKEYIDEKTFLNSNPIDLDLGCGLGAFAIEIAKQNPNKNFIAVEMFSNIIISAIEKAREENISNLKFLNCRIECIEKYIKDDSIDTIYLNFSNPLPNKSDEKQRLTSKRFLDIYSKILKQDGKIIQKTDDLDFFEYSLLSYKENGFIVKDICYDLKSNPIDDNIVTEHEEKYMREGKKICRVVVYKC